MIRNTITQMTAGLLAVSFMPIPTVSVSAEAGPGVTGSVRPPVQHGLGDSPAFIGVCGNPGI